MDALEQMIVALAAPQRVTLELQKWAYPCGLDVWPAFFKCITYWQQHCGEADGITHDLCKRMVANLLLATFTRAGVSFNENVRLNCVLMACHPYCWEAIDGQWRLERLVNVHLANFQRLVPCKNGAEFVAIVFQQLNATVRLLAPATLAGCCSGTYVDRPVAPAQPVTVAQAGETMAKRSKANLDALFKLSGVNAAAAPRQEFAQDLESEASSFVRKLGEMAHHPTLTVYQTLIDRRECPRFVHVALRFMAMPGANASSESVFSDTNFVTSNRRARTSAEWAETQVMIHRNYDTVQMIREMAKATQGASLESAWNV